MSRKGSRRRRKRERAQVAAAAEGTSQVHLVSAAIDPHANDRFFRPLGAPRSGLRRNVQERMQRLASELWTTNLMGKRLIEVVTDHVVGEGVSWRSEDERALEEVESFWSDPVNQLDLRFERLVSELGIFGELLLPVAVAQYSGRIRLGYISPHLIEEVVTDPDNCALPIGVVLKRRDERPGKRVKTILAGDPREYLSRAAQRERETFTDGEAFLFQINKASDAPRGASDILPAIDWIDIYERFVFDAAERARIQSSFIYDVTLKGAGPEQIAEWLAQNGVSPRPSSVRVHNEKEEWDAVSPRHNAGDSGTQGLATLIKSHMLGGQGYPFHWFGLGENANRASAESMDQPTLKMMTRRQRTVRYILIALADKQLEEAHRVGRLSQEALAAGATPVLPELSTRDVTKLAAALQQVTTSAVVSLREGLLSQETAAGLVAHMAGQLGYEVDPAVELERADREEIEAVYPPARVVELRRHREAAGG